MTDEEKQEERISLEQAIRGLEGDAETYRGWYMDQETMAQNYDDLAEAARGTHAHRAHRHQAWEAILKSIAFRDAAAKAEAQASKLRWTLAKL